MPYKRWERRTFPRDLCIECDKRRGTFTILGKAVCPKCVRKLMKRAGWETRPGRRSHKYYEQQLGPVRYMRRRDR